MDAVKYFEEKRRMLDSLGRTNGMEIACRDLETLYPEEAVAIVEEWSKEHPRKTLLQDFMEKHPKAKLNDGGTPKGICPKDLGYCEGIYCGINKLDCVACWNRPLEE